MENSKADWSKFFFGLAIVTILSGIYLIFIQDYVAGIGGSITGLFLIYLQKMNVTKEESGK